MQVEARFTCSDGHEEVFYNSWSCPVCDAKREAFGIFVEQAAHTGRAVFEGQMVSLDHVSQLRMIGPIGTGQGL